MYEFTGRIRFSETDASGRLSLAGLLDYFQDCATMHSDDVGLSVAELRRRRTVWVLSAWQVIISRLPEMGERVRCVTNPYDIRGFLGYRNFVLETEKGERLSIANSVWGVIDPETGKPVRIGEDVPEKYGLGQALEMPYASRRIKVGGEPMPDPSPLPVLGHMLDTNGHMNNARYVSLAEDCLMPGVSCRQLRVEYKRPARRGDVIFPKLYAAGEKRTVVLCDGGGEPYAVVEFS